MKNNNLKLLINPFNRFAGWSAFGIGLVIVLVCAILGNLVDISFPAVLDVKITPPLPLAVSILLPLIGSIALFIVMALFALIFARHTRVSDLLATVFLSRFPLIFCLIQGIFVGFEDFEDLALAATTQDVNAVMENISLILFSLLSIPFIIWYVILLFNGYKVSTGLNGAKLGLTFILSIIIGEIVSLIFTQLLIL